MSTTELTAWDDEGRVYVVLRTDTYIPRHDHLPPVTTHRLAGGEPVVPVDDTGRRLQTLDGRLVLSLA